jgi:hypothetical protein
MYPRYRLPRFAGAATPGEPLPNRSLSGPRGLDPLRLELGAVGQWRPGRGYGRKVKLIVHGLIWANLDNAT